MTNLELISQASTITLTLGDRSITLSPNAAGQLAGQLLCAAHGGDADYRLADDRPMLVAVETEPAPKPIPIPRPTPPRQSTAPAATLAWSSDTGEQAPQPTFTARAREQMALHGIKEGEVMSVLAAPIAVVPPKFGDVDNYRGEKISVLLSRDGQSRIIGVNAFPGKSPQESARDAAQGRR